MRDQPLWNWLSGIPVASGLLWLYAGWHYPWGWVLALIPGCIHIGGGVSLLLWPSDRRIPQCLALSVAIVVVLALPAIWLYGPMWSALLAVTGVAVYFAAGFVALQHEPLTPGIPEPVISCQLAAKVALDDALLGYFVLSAKMPNGEKARRMKDEREQMEILLRQNNWHQNPVDFHRKPILPANIQSTSKRFLGQDYAHLSFESGYQPWPGDLSGERWIAQEGNRRSHAWMVRHPGPPRPWLLCIHGYRMGLPFMDLGLFNPRWLHHKLGLNLLIPVLPLHGPRRSGARSGDGYLDGDFSNFIHAETQAMMDLRSWLRWLNESEQAPSVGVLGYSLGGYNAALLSCLESGLACVIAGIPLVDITAAIWRNMPPLQLQYLESIGLTRAKIAESLQVISPLHMAPRVDNNHRHIFAGVADRLTPPGGVQRLAQHWNTEVTWYQGTHLSFGSEQSVSQRIRSALQDAGLIDGQELESTQFASGQTKA